MRHDSNCSDGDLYAHEWQPLSFVFETQLLDGEGRVLIRQPDIDRARVYVVCMKCHKHSYIETEWAGFYVSPPTGVAEEPSNG